jgi:hypothetical protein
VSRASRCRWFVAARRRGTKSQESGWPGGALGAPAWRQSVCSRRLALCLRGADAAGINSSELLVTKGGASSSVWCKPGLSAFSPPLRAQTALQHQCPCQLSSCCLTCQVRGADSPQVVQVAGAGNRGEGMSLSRTKASQAREWHPDHCPLHSEIGRPLESLLMVPLSLTTPLEGFHSNACPRCCGHQTVAGDGGGLFAGLAWCAGAGVAPRAMHKEQVHSSAAASAGAAVMMDSIASYAAGVLPHAPRQSGHCLRSTWVVSEVRCAWVSATDSHLAQQWIWNRCAMWQAHAGHWMVGALLRGNVHIAQASPAVS